MAFNIEYNDIVPVGDTIYISRIKANSVLRFLLLIWDIYIHPFYNSTWLKPG